MFLLFPEKEAKSVVPLRGRLWEYAIVASNVWCLVAKSIGNG
jgi:hypothetical protein